MNNLYQNTNEAGLLTNNNPYDVTVPNFLPQQYAKNVQDDVRASFAADLNQLQVKPNSCHARSFIATIILIVGLGVSLFIHFNDPRSLSLGATIGICAGSYIIYLLMACICNDLESYLSNIEAGQHFEKEYDKTRALVGHFKFHAECYHYQTRVHHRTVRGSDGKTRSQTYTTREKVITHVASEYLSPRQTRDESGNVDRIHADKNIVFIHFKINYRFFDDMSRNRLDQEFYRFKIRHTRDSYQDFTCIYETPGLIEKMAFFVGELGCNFIGWFYLFGLIGFIWPYTLWVESKINRFDVFFTKVLKI